MENEKPAGSAQINDTLAKRHVWNTFNRVARPLFVVDGSSNWSYSTATWRQARAQATNQLDMVRGLDEDTVEANLAVAVDILSSAAAAGYAAIGLDSTTAPATNCIFVPSAVGSSGGSMVGASGGPSASAIIS